MKRKNEQSNRPETAKTGRGAQGLMKLRRKFTKENLKRIFVEEENRRHLKQGSYSSFLVLFLIAAVVIVNLIVGQLPTTFTQIDLSSQKLYTLTEDTRELVKGLEQDVTLYYIVTSGSEDDTVERLLERYDDLSGHITVETKDPNLYPNFISQYTDEDVSNNSIIVVCGDKSRVVSGSDMWETTIDYSTFSQQTTGFDGEGQITSAISYVTSEESTKLYWITGHGETEESALSSQFTDAVSKSNMEVEELTLLTSEIPEDADGIVIMAPTSDFSEEEADKVISYLEGGGKALIFSSYTKTDLPNFDSVLENYGVRREDGIVVESDSDYYYPQMPYVLLPEIQSSDITETVQDSYIIVPTAQAIVPLDSYRDSLSIESLLTTTDGAYIETDPENSTWTKSGDSETGAFDVGVSVTETVDDTETQIVYFSSLNMLAEQFDSAVSGANARLVASALNQMCQVEDSVSVPSKSLESSSLVFTAGSMNLWGIVVIAVIPAAFLIVGIGIWMKRRKQ